MAHRIITEYKGVEIAGIFLHRQQHYIEIEIIHPYINWTSQIGRNGPARMHPHSFEGPFGLEYAGGLLVESYRKLKMLDQSLDRILKMYQVLQKERTLIRENIGKEGEIICSKLYNEFFHSVFTSTVTGLDASYSERPRIIEILEHYKATGQRLFKANLE